MKLTWERYVEYSNLYETLKENYGPSPYYEDWPELVLLHDPGYGAYGEFCGDPLFIMLNFALCRSHKHLVQTLLHEYCHFLQPPEMDNDEAEERAESFSKDYVIFI